MKLLPLFLLLACALSAAEKPFRIGIFPNVRSVTVGPGAFKATALPGGALGVRTWNAQAVVKAEGKGLKIGGERFARKVRLAPAKEGKFVVVDGRSYRGVVELVAKGDGRLTVINEVEMEDYLRGVVSSEMPPSWPLEALKSQSVVARSYAAANRGRFGRDGYDLCATAACQVYEGVRAERDSTDRAVADTRGQVLVYKGAPISAVFHSCCGGRTDDSSDVWRGERTAYLRGVRGRWCREESPHYQWKAEIPEDVLSDRLRAAGRGVGRVTSVRIASRTAAGRAYEVRVTGKEGGATLQANAFRLAVGSRELRSTWWTGVSRGGGKWRFHGKGWGHGVGLCQWCAKGTAAQGYKYKEILAYFYRNAKVKTL